jgi:uncharacterized Ntn-hydrolase superfamily protein
MTYSIVARDPMTGDLGVAVQSRFIAVGAVVPWARAGVGAVATQAYGDPRYGPQGLDLLASGHDPKQVLDRLTSDDPLRAERQAGLVDAGGRSATHTGQACFAWAGGRAGEGYAAQGNILAGPAVVDALVAVYLGGGRPLPELLMDCLVAAQDAGGDRRGMESAALLVVRARGGYGGVNDRWIDLRVDDHVAPIPELARLLDLHRLYLDAPSITDLIPIDETIAQEVQHALTGLGGQPGGSLASVYQPMDSSVTTSSVDRFVVGKPRSCPDTWTEAWQHALLRWMEVENLEMRTAAMGWIDPRVLTILRERGAKP